MVTVATEDPRALGAVQGQGSTWWGKAVQADFPDVALGGHAVQGTATVAQ